MVEIQDSAASPGLDKTRGCKVEGRGRPTLLEKNFRDTIGVCTSFSWGFTDGLGNFEKLGPG